MIEPLKAQKNKKKDTERKGPPGEGPLLAWKDQISLHSREGREKGRSHSS